MNGPAGMGINPATGGPVGAPHMNQMQPQAVQMSVNPSQLSDMQLRLNTYIYDHLIVSKQFECARIFQRAHSVKTKSQPSGVPSVEPPKENVKRPDDLEDAEIPPHLGEHSFLMDWFCMFWDTYKAAKQQPTYRPVAVDYMTQQRLRSQDTLKLRMGMNAMNMNNMNGMKPGQGRPTQQMQAELQRRMQLAQAQGQGPDGQRPQTPGSMDNAPSPSKKPRLDNGADFGQGMVGQGGRPMGNMLPNGMDPQQMAAFAAQNGQLKIEGINGLPAQVGARMPDDVELMQRGGVPGNGPGGDGRHALQDYQLQLMLLEQQNKKRLLQARREQDQGPPGANPGPQGMINNGVFAPNMSPQGSRGGGPSPNPADQMKRGTPKLAQSGLPGSPMGDMQRNSPSAQGFDPSNGQMGAMPANYYQQQGVRQPQTSHPNFQQMNMQGMNAQQLEQMQRMNNINNGRMMNGQNVPGGQAMPFNGQGNGAAVGTPQQRPGNMAPPPAPTEGPVAQPGQRAESSPAQPAAPPTPSQTNKPAPKKKETAAQKKKNAPKKGANAATAATPTESADAPASTPATPMTPAVRDTFPKSGAPSTTTQALAPPAQAQAQPVLDSAGMFNMNDPTADFDVNLDFAAVGSTDVLDNFDFDSFLTTTGEDSMGGFEGINFDGNENGIGSV